MKRVSIILSLCAAFAMGSFAGCGSDDDDGGRVDAPAATPDAPAGTPDSAMATACDNYCDCMVNNCSSAFPSRSDCLTACAGLSDTALSCRTQHCGFAMTDPGTHCPHAQGQAVCQ